MKEESTDFVLEKILNSNNFDDVSKVMNKTDAKLDKTLQDFFNEYFQANPDIVQKNIVKDSDIDKSYAYQMINGKKPNPGRDYVIALCYAARMNLEEVNHALIYSNNKSLHSKSMKDANLIFAFSHNKKDKRVLVSDLNLELSERGIEPLKISRDGV